MNDKIKKSGFVFKTYEAPNQSPFEKLFEIFKELITYTSGDFDEAIDWLRQLDVEYKLTTPDYTIDDFIEDLKNKGYIREEIDPSGNGDGKGKTTITAKTERAIRQQALDHIFGKIKRSGSGNHKSKGVGLGDKRDVYFEKEFILWGLVQFKKLSKYRYSEGLQIKDPYGSYISGL